MNGKHVRFVLTDVLLRSMHTRPEVPLCVKTGKKKKKKEKKHTHSDIKGVVTRMLEIFLRSVDGRS